jgi:hypothetical protein
MDIKAICSRHQINPAHVSEFEKLVDGKPVEAKFGQRVRWVTNYREAYDEILATLSIPLQHQFPPKAATLEPWEP